MRFLENKSLLRKTEILFSLLWFLISYTSPTYAQDYITRNAFLGNYIEICELKIKGFHHSLEFSLERVSPADDKKNRCAFWLSNRQVFTLVKRNEPPCFNIRCIAKNPEDKDYHPASVFEEEALNSENITTEKLEKLPKGIRFPNSLEDKISYDVSEQLLTFKGVMKEKERAELLKLSRDSSYQNAVTKLCQNSLNVWYPKGGSQHVPLLNLLDMHQWCAWLHVPEHAIKNSCRTCHQQEIHVWKFCYRFYCPHHTPYTP